jgi:Kef-type K+ transport system membrane component KefB
MRRVAILILLFAGVQLIIPLEVARHGAQSESLLVFGFLVLAAYTMGELAKLVRLPMITGYLFAGILFGPWMLGVVPQPVIEELRPVERLAIALIAFLAGAELRWSELRERARAILTILGTELLLSFGLIVTALVVLRRYVPFFTGGAMMTEVLALAALFAAVAIVHSPAVTMALLTETGARGPVARTTLGVVLVADVVVVLLFSGALALARTMVPAPGAGEGLSAGTLAWEIGGSVLVGAALGAAIALYLRFVQRELLMFAIVIAFFGAEIARLAHVETLLTLLVAGFVTENFSGGRGRELLHAMERSAAPFFVVFFALAGASIDLDNLAAMWMLALVVVLVRAAAIWAGATLGARWSGAGEAEQRYVWMGLISQAGVALGLVAVIANAYPSRGAEMRTLLLAVIALNTVIGQVVFKVALSRAKEIVGEEIGEAEQVRGASG